MEILGMDSLETACSCSDIAKVAAVRMADCEILSPLRRLADSSKILLQECDSFTADQPISEQSFNILLVGTSDAETDAGYLKSLFQSVPTGTSSSSTTSVLVISDDQVAHTDLLLSLGADHFLPADISQLQLELFLRSLFDRISKGRQASQNHGEAERLLQSVLDALHLGVFWKDRNSRFLGMNRVCMDTIGVAVQEETIGKTAHDIESIKPAAEEARAMDSRVIDSGIPEIGSMQKFIKSDGEAAWLRVNKVPLKNAAGDIVGVLGSFEDITREYWLQTELERAHSNFQSAQAMAEIGSWEYNADTGEQHWSEELYRIFEIPTSAAPVELRAIGRFYSEPGEAQQFDDAIRRCLKTGEDIELEMWLTTSDGNRKRVRHLVKRISEVITRGSVQDITRLHERDASLRESQQLLQTVINQLPFAVFWKDRSSRYQGGNDCFLRFIGKESLDAVVGKTGFELGIDPKFERKYQKQDRQVINDGQPMINVVARMEERGQEIWTRSNKVALLGPDGEISGVLGTLENITAERELELENQHTRRLLQATQEIGKIGGWQWYVDQRSMSWSDEVYGIFELDKTTRPSMKPLAPYWTEGELRRILKMTQNCAETGTPYTLESAITMPDGSNKWVRVTGRATRDRQDIIIGVTGTFQDMTSEYKERARAKWNATLLQRTADVSGVGGWCYVIGDDHLEYTEKLRDILQMPTGVVMSLEEGFQYCHPDDKDSVKQALALCIASAVPIELEARMHRADGKEIWAHITGVATLVADRPVEIFGSLRDVTEERKLLEEQRSLAARVQHAQKLESLGVMAGGIAHDFNNLLVSMMGYGSMALKLVPEDSPARQMIANAVDASQKAADLTKQMLAYSGKGKFVSEPVAINDLIRDMASILGVALPVGVKFKERYASGVPVVKADKAQLTQVIMNLISNAGESINGDGVVTISTSLVSADEQYLANTIWESQIKPGRYVSIEVADTGSGMSEETLDKLFEPFFTTKFTGRGLGLAAVLGIVRGHNGAIHVTSELGEGTTFQVLLPVSNSQPLQLVSVAQPVEAMSGWALVVDDEEGIREIAKTILEAHGMQVETARDGLEGVESFRANPDRYSVVILDMTMPALSGLQAFKEIRKLRPEACVMLVSGYSELESKAGFNTSELSGFIQKPFMMEEFVAAVSTAMSSTRRSRLELN